MNDILAGDPAPTNPADELARLQARVEELETFARGCDGEGCVLPHSSWCRTARDFAAENNGCTCGEPWAGSPQTHSGHCWLLSPPDDELEWHRKRVAELLARVAELEADRAALRIQVLTEVADLLMEADETAAALLVDRLLEGGDQS